MLYSTNYFGNIPFFQSVAQHKHIIIDVYERYKKQTWRNRTQILESNGPLYLSVPVNRPNGNLAIVKDVCIENKSNWRKDHWKAIESSYMHAPYFFYYGSEVLDLIQQQEELLYLYNYNILKKILNWLDLDIEVNFSTEYVAPESPEDHRILLDKKQFKTVQESYIQVFSDRIPFYPNLSILDLLMNQGPLARKFILSK